MWETCLRQVQSWQELIYTVFDTVPNYHVVFHTIRKGYVDFDFIFLGGLQMVYTKFLV